MIENPNAERELVSNDAESRVSNTRSAQGYEMAGQAEAYESLQDLVGVLRKRWKFIAACVGACVLLAILACIALTSKYEAMATLEVNQDNSISATGTGGGSSTTDDVKTELETDSTILQSDGLALKVIEDLKLAEVAPFNRIHVKTEQGLPLSQAPKTREALIGRFEKDLKVASIPESRLIEVRFRNPDPAVAAKVANTLVETFISDTMQRRIETTSATSFWISKEIEGLRQRVHDSEQALADFQHKAGLAGLDLQAQGGAVSVSGHNAVLDRLDTLNEERTTAEVNRISTEAVYRLTQSGDPEVILGLGSMNMLAGGSAISQSGGLDLLHSLRSQEIALKGQYADMLTKYGAKNPRLTEVKTQLDTIEGELRTELDRIRKRAESDFKYAQANEAGVDAELKKQQGLANQYTDEAVQLQLLAQEAISNRTLYQNLFSELSQAKVSTGIHATRLDLVERALAPGSPVFPKPLLFVAVALAAGLFLGTIGAFVLQSADHTIRVVKDAEATVHLPVLSEVPMTSGAQRGASGSPLLTDPRSMISEAFHFLCTASVSLLDANTKSRALLVASPLAGDGKSVVAYNLAVALAQRGESVLLVDGDLRDPHQHVHFGVSREPGLTEEIRRPSGRFMAAVVAHKDLPNLSLLAAGAAPQLPAELFSSISFDQVLDEARQHFRWIVVDSPPTLPFTDATIIAGKVDGVLGVVRANVTSRDALKMFVNMLSRTNAPILGLVLNGVLDETKISMHRANEILVQKAAKHAA